mgnify:CR=1 FL=1
MRCAIMRQLQRLVILMMMMVLLVLVLILYVVACGLLLVLVLVLLLLVLTEGLLRSALAICIKPISRVISSIILSQVTCRPIAHLI